MAHNELIDYYRRQKMSCSCDSSGTLLSERRSKSCLCVCGAVQRNNANAIHPVCVVEHVFGDVREISKRIGWFPSKTNLVSWWLRSAVWPRQALVWRLRNEFVTAQKSLRHCAGTGDHLWRRCWMLDAIAIRITFRNRHVIIYCTLFHCFDSGRCLCSMPAIKW